MLYTVHPSYTALILAGVAPAVDFETKEPKTDRSGRPLGEYTLLPIGSALDRRPETIKVKAPLAEMSPGLLVTAEGLVGRFWATGGKAGVSFTAEEIKATK